MLVLEGKRDGMSPLMFLPTLEPNVDVSHRIAHEHFSVVALRAD